VRPLNPILEKLSCAQTGFFRAADSVSAAQWNAKPQADEWSAAELLAHLVMLERAIIGPGDAENAKARSVPETISFPNVAGGEQDHPAQIADSARFQFAERQGRDAGRIASGARTNFGISGGDVEAGFERVLLAASVLGNVKRL
jgi:hypothetical protein